MFNGGVGNDNGEFDVSCIQPYVEQSLTNGFPLQQGVGVLAGNDECDSLLVSIVLSPLPDDGFS